MDARSFNGDVDHREFGPDPDADDCAECGAGPLADCAWWCQCRSCVTGREKAKAVNVA